MIDKETVYVLDGSIVDELSEKIYHFCLEQEIERKAALKTRLSLESVLLAWYDNVPVGTKFAIDSRKWMGRTHIILKLEGNKINPLENDKQDELGEYLSTLITNMGTVMEYSYSDGVNIVDMRLPSPPIGDVGLIAIAAAAALVIGFGMQSLFDAESLKYICEKITTPLFDTIMKLLGAVATVMIFTSIVSGVGCMGSISVLKDMGLKFVKESFGGMLRTCTLSALACPFIYDMLKADGDLSPKILVSLYEMLLNCIPANVVSPFVDGNTLQIVFLGINVGVIMLILGKEVNVVSHFVNQINAIAQIAMGYICKLVPLIVFLSFLNMILEGGLLKILASWKIVAGISVLCWLAILGSAIVTAKHCHISLAELIKNFVPVTIQGTMTGAPSSCFQQIEQIATKVYGIKKGLLDFTLPMGSILCVKGQAIYFMGIVAGVCELANVPISYGELLLLIVTSAVIGIACPPVPGASIAVLGMMFTQFHLPADAMGLVIPILFIIDMTSAGADATCMVHDIITLAYDLGRHDDTSAWKK